MSQISAAASSVDRMETQSSNHGIALWFDAERLRVIRKVGPVYVVLFLLAGFIWSTSLSVENQIRGGSYVRTYMVWGVFHYYLGAKYFREIGYFNLYTCMLEADHEATGNWDRILGARDMVTYRMAPRSSLPPCPRTSFTPERWNEFSRDVESFALLAHPIYYSNLVTDKGFNPPPSWVWVAKPLAEAVPISKSSIADTIVFNLDVIAVLIGLLIVGRSQGASCALLSAGLVIFYFGNFGQIGGNFLQYFWFPFLAASAALWVKRKPGLSGGLLGVAAGLQSFPLFFSLPIVIRGAIDFLRGRPKAEWRPHLRFSFAFSAVIATSLILGSLTGRGVGAWSEWQKKISIHKNYLQGEIFNIGLANFTAVVVSKNHNDTTNYVVDITNTFSRIDALKQNIWIYYALCSALVAICLLIVAWAPTLDLFGYGFLILYIAVNLSPYYYLSLALLPFMFWSSSKMLRLYTTCATVLLFAAHAIAFREKYIGFWYRPHLLSACSIASFFVGLALVSAFSYCSWFPRKTMSAPL